MTLAPARPLSAPSEPDGADPTVTAVVVSRRDPQGLAELLAAVLGQSLLPDAVLVLDRTAGTVLAGHDGPPRDASGTASDSLGAARQRPGCRGRAGSRRPRRHRRPRSRHLARARPRPGRRPARPRAHRGAPGPPRPRARRRPHHAGVAAPRRHDPRGRHPRRPRRHLAPLALDRHRRPQARRRDGPAPPARARDPLHARRPPPLPAGARRAGPGAVRPDDRRAGGALRGLPRRARPRHHPPRLGGLVRRRRRRPRPVLARPQRGPAGRRRAVGADALRSRCRRRRRLDSGAPPGGPARRPRAGALVVGAGPRPLDRRHLGRRGRGDGPAQAPEGGLGGGLVARLARPVPRHHRPVAHPPPPRGRPPRPHRALRPTPRGAHQLGRRGPRRPRVAPAPDRRRGQRPHPPVLAGQARAPPGGARHRCRRSRGRGCGAHAGPRTTHRSRVRPGRRRARRQPRRRRRALVVVDRRLVRCRPRRTRPGGPARCPARPARLARRPPPPGAEPGIPGRSRRRPRDDPRDAARGHERVPLPARRHPQSLGAWAGGLRLGDNWGRVRGGGTGPVGRGGRAHGAAATRRRPLAARHPALDRHERLRDRARWGGPRSRRPGAPRARRRARPRARGRPPRGEGARPGRRARAGRGAGPVARPGRTHVVAGRRGGHRAGPMGRYDARALAARAPAHRGTRVAGRLGGPPTRRRGRRRARPRTGMGIGLHRTRRPRPAPARGSPRRTAGAPRHRPGGGRRHRRADHPLVRHDAPPRRAGARAGARPGARRHPLGRGTDRVAPAHRRNAWRRTPRRSRGGRECRRCRLGDVRHRPRAVA